MMDREQTLEVLLDQLLLTLTRKIQEDDPKPQYLSIARQLLKDCKDKNQTKVEKSIEDQECFEELPEFNDDF